MTQTMMTETEDQTWMLDHTNSLVRQQREFMPTEALSIATYQSLIDTQLAWFAARNIRLVIVEGEYVFESLTPKPARKVKAPKQEKILSHSARATFKATGAVVYAVVDGSVTYHTTSLHGKVRGCVNTSTGEDCHSFTYRHRCSHSAYVDRKETERQEQLAVAAAVAPVILGEAFAQDLEQHIEDTIRTSAFVDPFAGMSREQKRLAYRDMYPDDFEYSAA